MDGVRARRQKSGSPFGRLFDEANDMIQMTCYQIVMAYLFRVDNALLELGFLSMNLIFFAMELKYLLCKELVLNLGEIGAVEVENLFATLMVIGGIYGSCSFEMTLGQTFTVFNWPILNLVGRFQWNYIIMTALTLL